MARLYQHRTYGTYYTKRSHGAGSVIWQVHPDGVAFLKHQGVMLGGDIPSYAMSVLQDRSWLFTREEAGQWREIDWAPSWDALGSAPSGHFPLWLARQKRDCTALLAASRRLAEGEQLAHHKEEAAVRGSTISASPTTLRGARVPRMIAPGQAAVAVAHPEKPGAVRSTPAVDRLLWLVVIVTALVIIAILAIG